MLALTYAKLLVGILKYLFIIFSNPDIVKTKCGSQLQQVKQILRSLLTFIVASIRIQDYHVY